MTSILLLHPPDADRDALTAYLTRAGCHVSAFETYEELRSRIRGGVEDEEPPVVVAQEAVLPDVADLRKLDHLPLLILGRRRRLPERPGMVRLDDPYFLNIVARELGQLQARGLADPGAASSSEDLPVPPPAPDQGLLLRGLAHAFNNPLSAALGWLQLLAVDLGQDDPRMRALHQVRTELQRLERLIQAVGIVGGRPTGLHVALDVEATVRDRLQTLEKEGLPVTLEHQGALPQVTGDPTEFALMLDLLLLSFLEERGRVRDIHVRLAREGGQLRFTLREEGGTIPGSCDPTDLGLLLRRMRHTRALGIAMASRILGDRLGGHVRFESGHGRHGVLVLEIPVVGDRPAEGAG